MGKGLPVGVHQIQAPGVGPVVVGYAVEDDRLPVVEEPTEVSFTGGAIPKFFLNLWAPSYENVSRIWKP